MNSITYFWQWPGISRLGLSLTAIAAFEFGYGVQTTLATQPDTVAITHPLPANIEPVRGTQKQFAENTLVVQQPECQGIKVVELFTNKVTYNGLRVKLGDCLVAGKGDFTTGELARARLQVGVNRGIIEVSEFSSFKIDKLSDTQVGLFVNKGRVRFSVTPLPGHSTSMKKVPNYYSNSNLSDGRVKGKIAQDSSDNADFQVETPVGVAGVQGTAFGLDVGKNGQTGISTLKGSVAVEAHHQRILVGGGQYTLISPDSPPTPPDGNPPLAQLRSINISKQESDQVLVFGQVGRMNIVYLNGEAIETDSSGNFRVLVDIPASHRLRMIVRGPAVTERIYVLTIR